MTASALLFAATADPGYTKVGTLQLLVTVQGLLFAAIGAAFGLTGQSTLGRAFSIRPHKIAAGAAVLLGLIGAGATLAWVDLFGGCGWPDRWVVRIEVSLLLAAIVMQPVLAVALAGISWRGARGK